MSDEALIKVNIAFLSTGFDVKVRGSQGASSVFTDVEIAALADNVTNQIRYAFEAREKRRVVTP